MQLKHISAGLLCLFISLQMFAQCPREVAVDDYNNVYLNTEWDNTELAWTGNLATCTPGTIANSVDQKVITRINYFRRMCDLNDNCVLDATLNSHCQESALMQEANNSLSHCTGANGAPCDTWLCSTANGILAAQRSNLAWGTWNFFDPITLYMEDSGAGNIAVGHRRWILYSNGLTFGNGVTPNRQALWVIGSGGPAGNNRDYIAYPPGDFIPAPLVFPRWSFGIPNANFTNATVTMVDENGTNIPLNIIYSASVGFGDISIVWEPTGINTTSALDVKYTVTVSNIANAPQTSYTYTTCIIPPVHPPTCPPNETWDANLCACQSPPPNCIQDLVITTNPIPNDTYLVGNSITSTGTVSATGDVDFLAGNYIDLLNNFEVTLGGLFLADIDFSCLPMPMNEDGPLLSKYIPLDDKKGVAAYLNEAPLQ